jgi:hypothetical protein
MRAAALRDPNKIGGGYAAPAPQCPFVAGGAAILGDFLARSGASGAARQLQGGELGGRFGLALGISGGVESQALSRSRVAAVARSASHGAGQGIDLAAKERPCRLIANLTLGGLGSVEVGPAAALADDRHGPPAPPFGRRPKTMRVALGRPSPSEFCLAVSTRFSCKTDRGGEPSTPRMGSGVWAALARDQRSGVRLGRKGSALINGVGGWQPLGFRGERANPAKLRALAMGVNGGGRR